MNIQQRSVALHQSWTLLCLPTENTLIGSYCFPQTRSEITRVRMRDTPTTLPIAEKKMQRTFRTLPREHRVQV